MKHNCRTKIEQIKLIEHAVSGKHSGNVYLHRRNRSFFFDILIQNVGYNCYTITITVFLEDKLFVYVHKIKMQKQILCKDTVKCFCLTFVWLSVHCRQI